MAGRAFAFADPKIIELAKTKFIPVTGDDWYQRRRQDDEGEFFRRVASQGPRKGVGGATRQGIYTLTADGELLEFKNAGQDVEATRQQLRKALEKWAAMPEDRRRPGAVTIPEHGPLDEKFVRKPPEGGLILKVHGRILDRKDREYVRGECPSAGGMKASRDFLWLTPTETQSLIPVKTEVGYSYAVPAAISRRIARFHLIDNTRGEPIFWKRADVKEIMMTLTVTAVDTLRLDGRVRIDAGERGYEAVLGGLLHFKDGKFDQIDVVAVGEHWGDDSVTRSGARPGRTLLGVAFSLADPARPIERIPPQGAREWGRYIGQYDD